MSNLTILRSILNKVNVSDDMISRGVRLTQEGARKVASKLNVSEADIERMLGELAAVVRDEKPQEITEARKRYSYESDFLGNVCIRDRKTGDTRNIMGQEAFHLLAEIERVGCSHKIIAAYFHSALHESEDHDLVDIDAEMGNQSGTYNFPFEQYLATAKFWVANGKFEVSVISIRDQKGEETEVDQPTREKAHATALEWVDKA